MQCFPLSVIYRGNSNFSSFDKSFSRLGTTLTLPLSFAAVYFCRRHSPRCHCAISLIYAFHCLLPKKFLQLEIIHSGDAFFGFTSKTINLLIRSINFSSSWIRPPPPPLSLQFNQSVILSTIFFSSWTSSSCILFCLCRYFCWIFWLKKSIAFRQN